jgi:hypothetical protein
MRPRKPVSSVSGPGSDPQQLMVRRLVAVGVGLLVIIVLVLGIKGCLNSRQEQALKDYNRDVASLVQEADTNTDEFYTALTAGGTSPTDVQAQINQSRLRAKAQTSQAKGFSVPGDMKPPHRNLVLTLGLLEEAMGKVAEKMLAALSTDAATAEPAVLSITAEMRSFDAADVLYTRRVAALIKQVLDDHHIGGQTIQASSFLPNLGWLDAGTVARRIHADAGRGAGAAASTQPATPGPHGHGLLGVSVGDVALEAGTNAANRVAAGSNITFNVKIANQGESPEQDVAVKVTIRGGGKTITAQATVDQTTPGNEVVVPVELKQAPPIGVGVKISVEVRKVNGESNLSNNKAEYPAIFTRS